MSLAIVLKISKTSFSSNVNGNEATYFVWYGPGSFVSYDAPVSISTPGMYYHERGNPCGVVRDTIVVIQLPMTVPVWSDIAFCNQPVNMTLDAGAGWDYAWNTGATTQSIAVTDTGYYKVDLSNVCATGSVDIHVSHEAYPEPSLSAYEGFWSCNHDAHILNPSPGFTYDTYHWSTGATTPTIIVGAPTANYSVTVTVGACTSVSPEASILFYPLLTTPSICIATVNAASGYNDVWFEPIDMLANVQGAENYRIYKLAGTYSLIGTIPASASAMVFTDSTSTPMVSAARYKVSVVDTCGDESVLSYGHGTIKINSNPGTGGVVDLTIVDSYWDESGTYSPSKYYILVDSLNNGNLAVMDSIDAVFNSYTVTHPFLGATYVIGVAFPWACANGSKSVALDQMSFSNKSAIVSGVDDYATDISVSIYPNPSTGVFTVKGENVVRIEVTDLTGRVLQIFDHPTSTLDLSGFADGMYNAHISTTQGSTNKSLIISH